MAMDCDSPNRRPAAGTPICHIDELPESGGRIFSIGTESDAFGIIVLRHGDTVVAWHNHCPHFGQPLARSDEHLIVKPPHSLTCNVHYARFRWQDGYCETGDCEGESLTAVAIEIVDGVVRFAAGNEGSGGSPDCTA